MRPTEIKSVESITIRRVTVDVKACNKTFLVYIIPHEEDGEISHEFFTSDSPFADMHYYTGICGSENGLLSFAEGAAIMHAVHTQRRNLQNGTS